MADESGLGPAWAAHRHLRGRCKCKNYQQRTQSWLVWNDSDPPKGREARPEKIHNYSKQQASHPAGSASSSRGAPVSGCVWLPALQVWRPGELKESKHKQTDRASEESHSLRGHNTKGIQRLSHNNLPPVSLWVFAPVPHIPTGPIGTSRGSHRNRHHKPALHSGKMCPVMVT